MYITLGTLHRLRLHLISHHYLPRQPIAIHVDKLDKLKFF